MSKVSMLCPNRLAPVIFLCFATTGCDQVLKRLETSFKSSSNSDETKLEVVGLKRKEASLDSDQTRPVQGRTNDHDQFKGNLRPAHGVNKSFESKSEGLESVLTDEKLPSKSFSLNIDKEVDIGNGVIFDMRPDLPEIRQRQESN